MEMEIELWIFGNLRLRAFRAVADARVEHHDHAPAPSTTHLHSNRETYIMYVL
jgi:hypothetical protein